MRALCAAVVIASATTHALAQPAVTDPVAPAPAAATPSEPVELRYCTAIFLEPLQLAFTTLGVGVERGVAERITVMALAGFGRTSKVTVGDRVHEYSRGTGSDLEDVRFTRIHAGAQGLYYQRPSRRGIHFGADITYRFYGFATQDFPSSSVVTVSALAGWKWIAPSGFSAIIQGGASLVFTAGGLDGNEGLALNTEGTFDAVHLYGFFGAGWSF